MFLDNLRAFRELGLGMQESVEASRDWFITCEAYAAGMAAQLAAHALQLTSFEAQQPLLYLINAVLFAGYAPDPLSGPSQQVDTRQEDDRGSVDLEWCIGVCTL